MENFVIIQAICRSALANDQKGVTHHVERLKAALEKQGNTKEALALKSLISKEQKSIEMTPSRLERSFLMHGGEELTSNVIIPVDKETATPLCEIIFTDKLPDNSPYFSEEVSSALFSILEEWGNYEKLLDLNAQPSRSCLIYGIPGTGKTHLALWIAKQIGLPVVLARLDGLMSSLLGTTSRNIGNLFAFAAKYRCLLLLDEFDAIAKLRNDPQEVGEIKRVVNTLLQNLDTRKKIGFTIGITNHEQLLDPAIWRRFDVQIEIPKPSRELLKQIIEKFLLPTKLDESSLRFLSWAIEGASGADVESLIKWLKKSFVLSPNVTLKEQVKQFALLNSGRVSNDKKAILQYSEEKLAQALHNDLNYNFTQKEIAALTGMKQATVSRKLKKSNTI